MKKYELTDHKVWLGGMRKTPVQLQRVRALRDFGDVKAGDLGGWVEKEENLSQEGTCWVYDDAMVYDEVIVRDDANVKEHAIISGRAIVRDCAIVEGQAEVRGNVTIGDHARVYELAEIDENAIVKGVAIVRGTAFVSGNAQVRNAAIVEGKASVSGNACIIEAGRVSGAGAVHRNAVVKGYSTIGTDACIQDAKDVYTVAAATPSSPCFTFYKTVYNGMGVYISRFEKNFFCQKDFTEWAKKRPDYKDKRLFYKNAVKKAKEEILGAA